MERKTRLKRTTKEPITTRIPWKKTAIASNLPLHLDYFDGTMIEMVEQMADKYPNETALYFMGRRVSYRKMMDEIEKCAKALKVIGVRENDCVTIALPNCPQAIYMFYAVNLVGGIANMVHPLSGEKEIENFLNMSNSVTAVTLDQFYHKFEKIRANTNVVNIIIASIKDELTRTIRAGYMLTEGYKIAKIPNDAPVIRWKQFMKLSQCCFYNYRAKKEGKNPAVILYSGGTTGIPKGIVHTNSSFNSFAAQIIATNPMFRVGDKMLAALPMFHGFGLGVCIHSMLASGGSCILIPRITPKTYAKQIIKHRPNLIAGVPTLYEALLRLPSLEGKDLSFLKGIYSGGDSLSIELKRKIDKFLYDHHATIQVREGYGTAETVAAVCLTPPTMYKEGSIGIPFPDTYIKIVKPDTEKEVPYGIEGEIVISGPTNMKRYWDNPKETAQTIRKHKDGLIWIYTGDLGVMDSDGYIYFKGRSKRMIITSGYNVYPAQLENIIEQHPNVQLSCVIGVPDAYKMKKIKAFVVLKKGVQQSEELKNEILNHCRKNLAKYEMPREIEFRDELPKTLIGKINFRLLEKEELERYKLNQS